MPQPVPAVHHAIRRAVRCDGKARAAELGVATAWNHYPGLFVRARALANERRALRPVPGPSRVIACEEVGGGSIPRNPNHMKSVR